MPNIVTVRTRLLVATFVGMLAFGSSLVGQVPTASRVTAPVDDAQRISLRGSTHPLIRVADDLGVQPSSAPIQRALIVLQRSAAQETELESLLARQQETASSSFHQWLTPQAFGAQFGPSDADLAALTGWLARSGFTGIGVNAARTVVEFSGTESTLESAFHTALHRYALNGALYTANNVDPQVPAALAPIVAGFASLNDFPRHAYNQVVGVFRRDARTGVVRKLGEAPTRTAATAAPQFTFSSGNETYYGITPADFAAIYNVSPLWSAATPIDGTGQTIAIVGETDINPRDFLSFRTLFGMPLGNTATSTGTQYLNIVYNGPNPGINGDETEADIDTQWAAAAAPRATIDFVASASTSTTQGIDLSAQYIVDNNLAPVMSESYGECELYNGTGENLFYNNLWQQAAAQGITAMVSAGDAGAAGCDEAGSPYASAGNAVNGLASTPYNVAVGGTDFNLPRGGAGYFSSSNSSTYGSALSYVPEIPWNNSCANPALTEFSVFVGESPATVCNSATAANDGLLSVVGGGGGASSCIASNGTTSSSCTGGYAKPSWQSVTGVPADGVRDLPDVSLFAANGFFGAFTVVCEQDENPDTNSCNLNSPYYDFVGVGGTSVASPSFAGIMALVNQKTGSRQGNVNYALYNLFQQQIASGASCPATLAGASTCLFHDISFGSNSMPCAAGTLNCASSGGVYGTLSGGAAAAGYDTASGLGSVNAANLVNGWSTATLAATRTTLSLSAASITHGSAVTATVGVTSSTGTPSGNVSVNGLAPNGAVLSGALNGSAGYTASAKNFPGGTYNVSAHFGGSATFAQSDSPPVTLTVNPEPSTASVAPLLYSFYNGNVTSAAANVPYGAVNFLRFTVSGASGQGTATGDLTATDNGQPLDGGVLPLTSAGTVEDFSTSLTPGVHNYSFSYAGDPSFKPSSGSGSITITPAATTLTPGGSTAAAAGSVVSLVGYVQNTSFGYEYPTGTLSVLLGNTTLASSLVQPEFTNTGYDYADAQVSFLASQLTAGNNTVKLVYSGDGNYLGSSSTASITVSGAAPPASSTQLSITPPSGVITASFTITASILPASPAATGSVEFDVDGEEIGYVSLSNGIARLVGPIPFVPGVHTLTSIYQGDANHAATIATQTFTILGAATPSSASVSLSQSTVTVGQSVTAVGGVTPTAATGTLQLVVDGNDFGLPVTLSGGAASLLLSTSTLQPGAHNIAVAYSGDATYLPSVSTTAPLTLNAAAQGSFLLSLNSSAVTVTRGTPSAATSLTLTPTGSFNSTVSFSCSGLPSGAACVFTPATVSLSGASAGTSLVFTATAPTTAHIDPTGTKLHRGAPAVLALLALFLLPRKRRYARLLVLPLLFGALGLLSACGSKSSTSSGPSPYTLPGTPTGNYTVIVTASSAPATLTSTITLTVQ